ncbi:MAG: PAS domain S-box-containing protein [Pseudohongiellaceae bacterium]|jgi:PAS domain S-box-containing protein
MTETDISYNLIAGVFIVILTIMPTAGLRVDYMSSRKPYLGWACIAGLIAIARQVPDGFLGLYPESNLIYLGSSSLQFLASIAFLVALWRINSDLSKQEKVVLAVLVTAWIFAALYLVFVGMPQSVTLWYVLSTPTIVATLLIFLQLLRVGVESSTSRVLLLVSSFALLALRAGIPASNSIEMVYLLYFMELLLFPVLLTSLHLSEVQATHEKVKTLLSRRTQSEANVQFILDHSMDIIVAVNSAGLLTSWNKGAEAKFGFTSEQAIGKVHIDDFFYDQYYHRDVEEPREFDARMENVDGENIAVRVRIKTIHESDRSYTIYMLRDLSAIGEINKSRAENELERTVKEK